MSKKKRPSWWKMFDHQRAAIESVSDAAAGEGLKAAFRYFDGENIERTALSSEAFIVFCVIRPYIDESWKDYNDAVENGAKGANSRWGNKE